MNFYKYIYNTRIFNYGAQINYITEYICFKNLFISSKDDFLEDDFLEAWRN